MTTILATYAVTQYRNGLSSSTIDKASRILSNLDQWLGYEADHLHLMNATTDDLEAWLDAHDVLPATRRAYRSHAHTFYDWAIAHGHYPGPNPLDGIPTPKVAQRIAHPTPDSDLKLALQRTDYRDNALIMCGCYEGLRRAEIAGLRWEHIVKDVIRVVEAKGDKERMLPLHPDLKATFNFMGRTDYGPVFHTHLGGRVDVAWVAKRFAKISEKVGVPIRAHDLRHFFASKLMAQTHDILLVQNMLGHASIATTQLYCAFDQSSAALAIANLHVDD